MKQKNNSLLSILALILALAALALSAVSFATRPEDQTHLIDDLYEENHQLQQRVETLENQLQQMRTVASLQSWALDVQPWADSTGADITFTAVPADYQPGLSAALLVELAGEEFTELPCEWDGAQFVAAVSLDALDGYGYYCRLTSPAGEQLLPLSTPDSPNVEAAVYLQSSLSAYCNLVVNDWRENGEHIQLTDAYAQVQLPWIGSGGIQIAAAELVLRLNGEASVRIPVSLAPSEVAGSCEAVITDLDISLPELQAEDSLELYLEVSLSDGRNLSAFGINWYLDGGTLASAVG